jgi:hypothetical protein
MCGEEFAPDQILLGWRAEPYGDVRLAHGEVKDFVVEQKLQSNIRIELHEVLEPRGEPAGSERPRGCDLELSAWLSARVRKEDLRCRQFAENFLRRAVKKFALLGRNESARMPVKKRNIQVALKGADMAADCRLAEGTGFSAPQGGAFSESCSASVQHR